MVDYTATLSYVGKKLGKHLYLALESGDPENHILATDRVICELPEYWKKVTTMIVLNVDADDTLFELMDRADEEDPWTAIRQEARFLQEAEAGIGALEGCKGWENFSDDMLWAVSALFTAPTDGVMILLVVEF